MSALVIAGQVIPVAQGWKALKELGEDSMRANAGSLSSDVHWEARGWSGLTSLMTQAEVTALRTATALAAQVACSGDLLGATVTCEVTITEAGYVTTGTVASPVVLRTLALMLREATGDVSPFRPTNLDDLQLWLDAGSIAQADNTSLAAWTNLAPSGAVAAQATSGSRPTFRLISGVASVRFPSAGKTMPVSWGTAQSTDEATTFIVCSNGGSVTTRQMVFHLGPDDASATAQLTYSLDMQSGVVFGRQNAPNPVGLAVPTSYAAIALAGSVSGAGLPEGRGLATYYNGRKFFRQQDANAFPYTSVTGLTTAVIGGLNTGGGSFNFTGDIRCILHYSRRLTELEIQAVFTYLAATYGTAAAPTLTRNLVFDGDSLTMGLLGQAYAAAYTDQVLAALPATVRSYNFGVSGQTAAQMGTDASTQVDGVYDAAVPKNTLVGWAGTNDINATPSNPTAAYNALVAYCTARRAKGFKVVVLTCLPRGTAAQFETDRQAFNTSVRTNWATFADALVDIGLDATIGVAGAQNNTTYYQTDKIHLITAGYAIVATAVQTAVAAL